MLDSQSDAVHKAAAALGHFSTLCSAPLHVRFAACDTPQIRYDYISSKR
jgi:hypothetical protein